LDRYFPELHDRVARSGSRAGCVVDGEIVIATSQGLDFDALQLRLHPAQSRVAKLAREAPSSFVAFDVLRRGAMTSGRSPSPGGEPGGEAPRGTRPPVHLTPMHASTRVAAAWLEQFEGAGLDGVVAKPAISEYQPASA
jgi:ATP-dependent DNA ligase